MNRIRALQEAAQEVEAGLSSTDQLPEWISHHIGDDTVLDLAGGRWDLGGLAIEPFHLGGITVDLSPTRQLLAMLLVAVLLPLILIPIARVIRSRGVERAPRGFANSIEGLILYFRDEVVRTNIGHGADAYTPFILTLFFFVLGMNLIGLTPLGITPTANLSVTAALATISFIVTEISGFRALGPAGYAKTIFFLPAGVPTVMKPLMLAILTPVELLGKLTKPFALAVRLLANMTAGHTLILAIMGMIFVLQSYLMGVGSVAMASVLMILELFVAFLQAYIFAMLTSVFIGLIRHAH
ncbi:MAG: ATP synthase F0 subunit A [Gemmatimonadetes bacterium]|nr:ATP synthase F0 subunit A [Gemmatimonadota bacterium]